MNFLDLVEVKKHLGFLKRAGDPSTVQNRFESIRVNNFEIHIYAGYMTFSIPPNQLDNLLHYSHVQVSILEFDRNNTIHTISPINDERFQYLEWSKFFTYKNSQGQDKGSYMGAVVPLDDVCKLIREIYKISRLKLFY